MRTCLEEVDGIAGAAVDPDLVVQMNRGHAAGGADETERLVQGDGRADLDEDPAEVGVARGEAVAVVDLDHVAVVAVPAGIAHDTVGRGENLGRSVSAQVDALMEGSAAAEGIEAKAEAVE